MRAASFSRCLEVGVLGHLLLNQPHDIADGIADGFHKERLFSGGYTEVTAMNRGKVWPGVQVFFPMKPIPGGLY
jgi:hypothetical protein